MWLDAENMRNCVSAQKNHIKWIFRPLANLELKSRTKLLYKNEKEFPWAVHECFMLKIGILWFRDIEKRPSSLSYEVPPLAPTITQYHGIMEYIRIYVNAWLGFRYCTFLQIFCVHLHSILLWDLQNCPILTILNLLSKSARFCGPPFIKVREFYKSTN